MPQDIKFAVCLLIPMLLLSWELRNGQENGTTILGYIRTTIRAM